MFESEADILEALQDAEHNYAYFNRTIDAIRLLEIYEIIEIYSTQQNLEESEPDFLEL